ncbi:MAG TPA: adenylate/guanylate cyclase domain-containing protein [Jiangellaceae bacterium]
MGAAPTGTVTFLFTDIEGSTGLLQALGETYRHAQDRHCEIVRAAIGAEDGHVVRTAGDSFFVAYASPAPAVRAAVSAQRSLAATDWPDGSHLRVRMGLHTGEGVLGGDDYIGIDVNRAARIAAAAHGGQVLLSEATRALVRHDLPAGVTLRDLGEHRLKDIAHPERLFDLVVDDLPNDFPPIRSLDVRPNNLPLQLTSFVGRADEIARAVQLLRGHRLVTLTGPGGAGKTRLALEVAAEELSSFEDGAFFVDLAPISDHTQLPSVLAQALGIRERPGRELIDTLPDVLAAMDVLLVLDNFEHLLPAASVVDRLLAAARRLRILVTSRAPLRLYGEQEHQVPPLALPDVDRPQDLDVLSRCEAIALFVERARAARPGFGLTDENAGVVADVCIRLDGLPLAIELAASRVKVLTPQAIRSRLAEGPDLLTASARNLPARQRTLRATIGWSCGLLTEPQRRLFSRLSVFRGGAGLDAVEAVGNPLGDPGVDTLDALSSLVDDSLVRQTEMPDGEPRFGMLETIREYAGELLAATEDEAPTRQRHAEHYLALAHEGEPHLTSDDQVRWLDRFEHEHDNLQMALRWTMEVGQPERGMAAAAAMWRFWHQRWYLFVGRSWLERLLSAVGADETAAVAKSHLAAGGLAYWQGEYQAARHHYKESLRIAQAIGDRAGIAEAIYNLAFTPAHVASTHSQTEWSSDAPESIALLQDALARFEELSDLAGVAKTKGNMALILGATGDLDSAATLLGEAIESYRMLRDRFHLADSLMAYGQGMQLLGRDEAARAAFVEALGLVYEADNRAALALALECFAALESKRSRHDDAMKLLGSAQQIRRAVEGGYPLVPSAVSGIDPLAEARTAIGDEAVERALSEGRSWTRAQAVAFATEH